MVFFCLGHHVTLDNAYAKNINFRKVNMLFNSKNELQDEKCIGNMSTLLLNKMS